MSFCGFLKILYSATGELLIHEAAATKILREKHCSNSQLSHILTFLNNIFNYLSEMNI